jgi:hypothetical protein
LNLLPPPGDELRSESNLPISDTAAREICRISDGEHFLLPAATAASAASPRWLPTASAAQGRLLHHAPAGDPSHMRKVVLLLAFLFLKLAAAQTVLSGGVDCGGFGIYMRTKVACTANR